MADKHIIPQEHHAGNGCLADKGGRSQPDHVADVTAGKPHAFPAQLDTVNTYVTGKTEEINECHQSADHSAQAGGKSSSHHSPAQLENKDIIEYDIDNGRYGVAHHGIVGRSVQADVKHAGA